MGRAGLFPEAILEGSVYMPLLPPAERGIKGETGDRYHPPWSGMLAVRREVYRLFEEAADYEATLEYRKGGCDLHEFADDGAQKLINAGRHAGHLRSALSCCCSVCDPKQQ